MAVILEIIDLVVCRKFMVVIVLQMIPRPGKVGRAGCEY
jgi:hypothetical protein